MDAKPFQMSFALCLLTFFTAALLWPTLQCSVDPSHNSRPEWRDRIPVRTRFRLVPRSDNRLQPNDPVYRVLRQIDVMRSPSIRERARPYPVVRHASLGAPIARAWDKGS